MKEHFKEVKQNIKEEGEMHLKASLTSKLAQGMRVGIKLDFDFGVIIPVQAKGAKLILNLARKILQSEPMDI